MHSSRFAIPHEPIGKLSFETDMLLRQNDMFLFGFDMFMFDSDVLLVGNDVWPFGFPYYV